MTTKSMKHLDYMYVMCNPRMKYVQSKLNVHHFELSPFVNILEQLIFILMYKTRLSPLCTDLNWSPHLQRKSKLEHCMNL